MWGTINVIYMHNSTKKISKDRQTSCCSLEIPSQTPLRGKFSQHLGLEGDMARLEKCIGQASHWYYGKATGLPLWCGSPVKKHGVTPWSLWVYCWLGPFLEAVLSTQHMGSKGKSDTNNDHTSSHTMLYCTLPEIPLNCEPTTQLWTNIFVTLLMCLTSNGYGVLKLADSRLMD